MHVALFSAQLYHLQVLETNNRVVILPGQCILTLKTLSLSDVLQQY